MTEIWKQSPFIRITPFFFLGIGLGYFISKNSSYLGDAMLISFLSVLFVSFFISILIHKKKLWKYRQFYGLSILYNMFLCGACFSLFHSPLYQSNHYIHTDHSSNDGYILRILEIKQNDKSVKGVAQLLASVDSTFKTKPLSGKVSFFIPTDSCYMKIDDVLFAKTTISSLSPPRHPGAFDYAAFSERKGIYGSIYIKNNDWLLLPELKTSSPYGTLSSFRDQQLSRLDEYRIHDNEKAIIAALVLGKTDDLNQDVMQGYSATGVIHVLAVSGLHVALVYMILAPIFKRIMPGKRFRWWRFFIPFSILWFYAALTGFSPSVLRSAVMFTLFLISEQFDESNHSLNTLFASALILAVYQPMYVFDIGFLLSYLAVGGIMTMQKKLQLLWKPRNAFLIYIKDMICVSIAAQLLTLPFTLWLFGQFPTYFLIANLLIIPLSTVVLYAGLAFFLLGFVSPMDDISLNISITFIQWMNKIIQVISSWPSALIKNIHVDISQMIILFFLLFLSWQLLFRRKKYTLFFLPSFIFLSFISFEQRNSPTCVISQVKKDIAIAFGNGDQLKVHYFSIDSVSSSQKEQQLECYFSGWMKERDYSHFSSIQLIPADLITCRSGQRKLSICVLQNPIFSDHFFNIVILPDHLSKKKLSIPKGTPSPDFLVLGGFWSEKKRMFLQKKLKIPIENIIFLRNGDFVL